MYKIISAITFSAFSLFSSCHSGWAFYSGDASSKTIHSVEVDLDDQADDSCWTNLTESRLYAEEKLRQKGYNVVSDAQYEFVIRVNSHRNGADHCIYTVGIEIYRIVKVDGMAGFHLVGGTGNYGLHDENANRAVIDAIKNMVSEM